MSSSDAAACVPSDIIREVLIHVRIKPLLQFRRVRKEWQLLINDPVFAKLHYNFRRTNYYKDMLIFRKRSPIEQHNSDFYYMHADSLLQVQFDNTKTTIEATYKSTSSCKYNSHIGFGCHPSCHGLVLLYPTERPDESLSLWKPLTGQVLYLPTPEIQGPYNSGAIGYLSANYEYKVVLIAGRNILIYSLKSQAWSLIKDFPYSQVSSYLRTGVFANGAIYWPVLNKSPEDHYLISLDLDTITYRKLSIPSPFGVRCRFDVLDEHLFLTNYPEFPNRKFSFNTWVLKDYGGEQYRWTKLISKAHHRSIKRSFFQPKPIAYMKSKNQVVISYLDDRFFWFDVQKKVFVKRVFIIGAYFRRVLTSTAEGLCWNEQSERTADDYKLDLYGDPL